MSGFYSKDGIFADQVIKLVNGREYGQIGDLMDKFDLPNPDHDDQAIYKPKALCLPYATCCFVQELLKSVGDGLCGADYTLQRELLPRIARSIDLHGLARHLLASLSDDATITEPAGDVFFWSLCADGETDPGIQRFIRNMGIWSDILGLLRFFTLFPGVPINAGYNAVILQKIWSLSGIEEKDFFYLLASCLLPPAEVVEAKYSKAFMDSTKVTDGGSDEEHGICTGQCAICKQDCPGH